MKKKDKFAYLLLKNPFPLLFVFFVISFKFSRYLIYPFIASNIINLIFSIIITELSLRLFLFIIYGPRYIYRFKPYFIKNDKLCGYKLRNNSDSKQVRFPIFDRFIFPKGTKIPSNEKKNIEKRVKFITNEEGFRTINISQKNIKRDLKIICSGGSTTAGVGINNNETWPNRLEEKLNNNGYNCQVINAGVYGYDSFQELQNLKYNLIKLKPDILILHQGWNEEFEFSALGAGKNFRPKHARGYFEKYYFFTNNIPFFPSSFLSILFSYRYIRRKICLEGHMNFKNRKRWTVLLNDQYIKNWYDNIFEIKKICDKNKISLFLTDFPCLVNNYDSISDKNLYIDNSRLTRNFAAYQSFSKSRIEEFFIKISKYFDILDGSLLFHNFKGKKRLNLFTDEIHLSAKGEELLAESIYNSLIRKLNNNKQNLKINLDEISYLKVRKSIGINSEELNIDIRRYISQNLSKDKTEKISVSTDIYTTS
tara:strand:- start:36974 stop:38413 length:1440 start_codon:yes stop_codon:yes gene_type:complete